MMTYRYTLIAKPVSKYVVMLVKRGDALTRCPQNVTGSLHAFQRQPKGRGSPNLRGCHEKVGGGLVQACASHECKLNTNNS